MVGTSLLGMAFSSWRPGKGRTSPVLRLVIRFGEDGLSELQSLLDSELPSGSDFVLYFVSMAGARRLKAGESLLRVFLCTERVPRGETSFKFDLARVMGSAAVECDLSVLEVAELLEKFSGDPLFTIERDSRGRHVFPFFNCPGKEKHTVLFLGKENWRIASSTLAAVRKRTCPASPLALRVLCRHACAMT